MTADTLRHIFTIQNSFDVIDLAALSASEESGSALVIDHQTAFVTVCIPELPEGIYLLHNVQSLPFDRFELSSYSFSDTTCELHIGTHISMTMQMFDGRRLCTNLYIPKPDSYGLN
jgi:hypothetical protein